MSSDYLTILQLTEPINPQRIEQAYRSSRARYMRLTARGPLRFYRSDLLAAVERAYRNLKDPTTKISAQPLSLLARQVAGQSQIAKNHLYNSTKPPVKSAVKENSILPERIASITTRPNQKPSVPHTDDQRTKAQIEDNFCREVIYRLEGDLIRYDSRRELLRLAAEWHIHLFQANMLIAQIVETVRQNKLYNPPPAPEDNLLDTIACRTTPPIRPRSLTIAAIITSLIFIADILLIYYLTT